MKWEYFIKKFVLQVSDDIYVQRNLQMILDGYGADGWELIDIVYPPDPYRVSQSFEIDAMFFFKRLKKIVIEDE